MNRFMPKMSFLILITFLWSCFGLGVGMVGHSLLGTSVSYDSAHIDQSHHECCTNNASESTANTSTFDHHKMNAVLAEIIKLLVLVTPFFFVLFVVVSSYAVKRFFNSYAVYWQRSILYFALYLQQLFRQGILHPKIW